MYTVTNQLLSSQVFYREREMYFYLLITEINTCVKFANILLLLQNDLLN